MCFSLICKLGYICFYSCCYASDFYIGNVRTHELTLHMTALISHDMALSQVTCTALEVKSFTTERLSAHVTTMLEFCQ